MAKKRATIKDVAARAGVSYQTGSRVINDKGEFSPDTQKRVLDAIAALNYRPSRVAWVGPVVARIRCRNI